MNRKTSLARLVLFYAIWLVFSSYLFNAHFLTWNRFFEAIFFAGLALLVYQGKKRSSMSLLFLLFFIYWSVVHYFFGGSLLGQVEELRLGVLFNHLRSSLSVVTDLPKTYMLSGLAFSMSFYFLCPSFERQKSNKIVFAAWSLILLFFVSPFINLRPQEEVLRYQNLNKKTLYYGKMEFPEAINLSQGQWKNKNLIIFILESVGSKNLSDLNCSVDCPWIKREKSSLWLWNDISNTFPSTTRSHIPLHTGGITFSMGTPSENLVMAKYSSTLPQVFKNEGFKTAVYSSAFWEFELLKSFYRKMQWDTLVDPMGSMSKFKLNLGLNSWGISEAPLLQEMKKEISTKKEPFFMVFINSNTHHPYESKKANTLTPSQDRYNLAVKEAFEHIDEIIQHLKKQNKLKDTVIAIMGDHGEAFGDLHPNNLLHKNYLYQENIQNFLMLHAFDEKQNKELFSTPISIGDIMPTLLDLWGLSIPKNIEGNSFFSKTSKLHFFHKTAEPEMFGLRDGEWKYIGKRYEESDELYNLKRDPLEKINLAGQFPDQIKVYRQLCFEWIWEAQKQFYQWSGQDKPVHALETLNKKGLLKIGLVKGRLHNERSLVNEIDPNDFFQILMISNSQEKEIKAEIRYFAPDGKKYKTYQVLKKELSRVFHLPSLRRPLAKGEWKISVILGKQQEDLKFTVK
jgi:hypothetical protein